MMNFMVSDVLLEVFCRIFRLASEKVGVPDVSAWSVLEHLCTAILRMGHRNMS